MKNSPAFPIPPAADGSVALVTGAGGILGPGICGALRDAGWQVGATDQDEFGFSLFEKVSGESFPTAATFAADISSQQACRDLIVQVEHDLGQIGLLVNNAAMNPPCPDIFDCDEAYLSRMTMVNLWAPYFLLQACLPGFVKRGGGAVINISSIQVERTWPGQLAYPTLKAGLETMSGLLARELGASHVRVNTVRVGPVPGHAFFLEKLRSLSPELARDLYQEMLPLHRGSTGKLNPNGIATVPEDIGAAVAFLASAAARQISGAVLSVDAALQHVFAPERSSAAWDRDGTLAAWERAHQPEHGAPEGRPGDTGN